MQMKNQKMVQNFGNNSRFGNRVCIEIVQNTISGGNSFVQIKAIFSVVNDGKWKKVVQSTKKIF